MAPDDFRRIFESLRVAVVITDAKGRVSFANSAFAELASQDAAAGIELINPGVPSTAGGRGVRLREHVTKPKMKNIKQPKPSSPRTLERVR